MNTDFYVVKFGEMYYKNMATPRETIVLSLVDDLSDARKYVDLDRKAIQPLLDMGGSVVEVSIREYDRTFSLQREWEEEEN